jgi:hypothetical protein
MMQTLDGVWIAGGRKRLAKGMEMRQREHIVKNIYADCNYPWMRCEVLPSRPPRFEK